MARAGTAVDAVVDVAVAALSAAPDVNPTRMVLDRLRHVVGADAAGLYRHERGGWTAPLFIEPVEVWNLIPFSRIPTAVAAQLHPGIRHTVTASPSTPFALHDLVSERRWLSSELGSLMRADWGRGYQLAVPMDAGGRNRVMMAWVLARPMRGFSRQDHEVAQLLQPVLAAVARQRAVLDGADLGTAAGHSSLTQRELAVLVLLADALSPQAAARRLGISVRTLHKHAEHVYRKLGVHDRYHAALVAHELGILHRDGPA